MGKLCQTCGLENPDDVLACNNCGTSFGAGESQTRPCESCGGPNKLGVSVCEFCGAPLKKLPPPQTTTSVAPVPQTPQVLQPGLPTTAPIKPQQKVIEPAKPAPVKKKGKSHAKSIIVSILYAAFCFAFFGVLLWLVMFFFPAGP